MLIDNQCSIYEHRPKTCRSYDCRIFPAAGLEIDNDDDKVLIARQARRWQFSFVTEAEQNQRDAVRAAATFLRERRSLLPADAIPTSPTQLAILALELHDAFLCHDKETGRTTLVDPDPQVIRAALLRRAG